MAGLIGINYLYRVTRPSANLCANRLRLICLLWISVCLMAPVTVRAQSLSAAADGSRFWLLTPEADQPDIFNIYHHAYTDPSGELNKVDTLRGEVRPHCIAARDDTLWIIYPDGTVQAIQAHPSLLNDTWVYKVRAEPRLPVGVSVRDTTLTRSGLWVLVRIEEQETLSRIDALAQPAGKTSRGDTARRQRNLAIGLPPGHGMDDDEDAETPSAESVPDEDTVDQASNDEELPGATALPVDRLLTLRNGQWRSYPLAQDWPHGTEAWLVADRDHHGPPSLAARIASNGRPSRSAITVYHATDRTAQGWTETTYPLDPAAEGVSLITVQDQLVLAQHNHEEGRLVTALSVLRNGKLLPVGKMTLDDVSPTRWAVQGTGTSAALIAQRLNTDFTDTATSSIPPMVWMRADMRGQTVLEPTGLYVKMRSKMDDFVQYAMLGFVVILITVLMLAFWRRDSAWNRLDLPPELIIADLPRRAAAAALDMAPGLLGAMFYFDLSAEELLLRWPGNGIAQTAVQMLPGAIVIAIFVTHTTITELFLARTLGKTITGLRTTSLTGERPRAWQLLVRGLLKCLDLLPGAWLLLMLPVIAPHRQRLGDLVGRTVVVSDAPPQADEDQNESEESLDD